VLAATGGEESLFSAVRLPLLVGMQAEVARIAGLSAEVADKPQRDGPRHHATAPTIIVDDRWYHLFFSRQLLTRL